MPITLTVVRGPQTGRSFTFDGHDTFLVGRSATAHFALPDDPYFSRVHFLVEVNHPLCNLTDLDSHNGTRVNGTPTKTTPLRDGDEIEGGQTVLKVAVRTGPADPVTPDLPPAAPPLPDSFALPGEAPVTRSKPVSAPSGGRSRPAVPSPGTLSAEPAGESHRVEIPVEPPPTIPGYRGLVELGAGGMGVVYKALAADGTTVAVKTIRPALTPNSKTVARFLREARVLEDLRHPHVVRFREMGEANGVLYFVMEFVPGTDAAKLARSAGPLGVADVARLAVQMCDGLKFAHDQGFVHRDVKPGNLLLTPEPGGGWHLKVADFGLARTYQASAMSGLTVSGSAGGTPQFMPPEQVTDFKSVKPAADQYAAAVTVYHLLTARYPFNATGTAELLKLILTGKPTPLTTYRPDVPAGVAAAVERGMATRPADRYPDIAAFAAAVKKGAGL